MKIGTFALPQPELFSRKIFLDRIEPTGQFIVVIE
jgi:hypothetical protein